LSKLNLEKYFSFNLFWLDYDALQIAFYFGKKQNNNDQTQQINSIPKSMMVEKK